MRVKELIRGKQGIAASRSLKKLSFSRTSLGSAGLKALLPFLKENTSIESLDLSGCALTDEAIPLLADLLMVSILLTFSVHQRH